MLIVDEISYVSYKFFGRIEKRLREIIMAKRTSIRWFGSNHCGRPPVNETALYTSIEDFYLRNKHLYPATTAGVQYVVTLRRIVLKQQMRFTDDEKHMTFHAGNLICDQKVLPGLIKKTRAIRSIIRFVSNYRNQQQRTHQHKQIKIIHYFCSKKQHASCFLASDNIRSQHLKNKSETM